MYILGSAYDQVKAKVSLDWEFLGERSLRESCRGLSQPDIWTRRRLKRSDVHLFLHQTDLRTLRRSQMKHSIQPRARGQNAFGARVTMVALTLSTEAPCGGINTGIFTPAARRALIASRHFDAEPVMQRASSIAPLT